MSRDALDQFQAEAAAAVDAARAAEAQAKAALAQAMREIELARADVTAAESLTGQLRQELAAAAATNLGLEAHLDEFRRQLAEAQVRLERAHEDHATEREKLAERSRLAEQRFGEMEKRALLDMDRGTASAKLQKILESERAERTELIERLRSDCTEAQTTLGALRERTGALQQSITALQEERDRALNQAQSTRDQRETAIRQAAAATARADNTAAELERIRTPIVRKTRAETSRRNGDDASGNRRRKAGDDRGFLASLKLRQSKPAYSCINRASRR